VGLDAAVLAGRALYINELTRREPRWADWVPQNDNSLVGPEALIAQLNARPDQALLESVKEILQYATPAWLDLFTQLDGLSLLIRAAEQHTADWRAQQQQQQEGGGSGGGGSSHPAVVRGGERLPAADTLAAAMECVAAVMGRSGGDRLLVRKETR
jgi:hypothetical protein